MPNYSFPADKIAAQEAEVARLDRELDLAKAVLRGMKAMLPETVALAVPSSQGDMWERGVKQLSKSLLIAKASKGRQPGAISQQWRNTLCRLLITRPDGFTDDEAAAAAMNEGLPNIRPKDAADRLASYLGRYVERLPTGGWRITNEVEKKYPNTIRRQRDALQDTASSSKLEEAT
jgi:hypothetical protein